MIYQQLLDNALWLYFCGGVAIAHFTRRSRLSTGAQTTDYRRGYPVSVPCISFLTLLPVGRACCTLLRGIVSRENSAVLGMGFVIARKPSHDHGYTCRLLDVSHLDLNEIALSTMWMLDTRAF